MLKIIASFLVGFVFVMHAFGDFTAHADHQGKEGLLMTGKHSVLPDEKELIDEISKTAASRIIGIGGRKKVAAAALKAVMIRNGELAPTTISSANTGATCDSEARKGDLNVTCKHGRKSSSAKKKLVVHHDHFVAFGADYHGPARHPPKHN